jgi:hypothetical protein
MLFEKWADAFNNTTFSGRKEYVEIYSNPTKSEGLKIPSWANGRNSIRCLILKRPKRLKEVLPSSEISDHEVYCLSWDSRSASHNDIVSHYKMKWRNVIPVEFTENFIMITTSWMFDEDVIDLDRIYPEEITDKKLASAILTIINNPFVQEFYDNIRVNNDGHIFELKDKEIPYLKCGNRKKVYLLKNGKNFSYVDNKDKYNKQVENLMPCWEK